MATRDEKPIELLWLLVDPTHARAGALRTAARTRHESQGPFVLSVNESQDGTRALIKVAADADWHTRHSSGAAVLRAFTERDHAEAIVITSRAEWMPVASDPGDSRRG